MKGYLSASKGDGSHVAGCVKHENNIRPDGPLCLYVGMYGQVGLSRVMYGHVESCLVRFDHVCMELDCHVQSFMVMNGHVWSCMVIFGQVMVMYGHV